MEKGSKHTRETIKKIKEARKRQGSNVWIKGKKGLHLSLKTEFKKGQPAWNRGKKYHNKPCSIERRIKIGKAQLGKKNHNWKGGITPLRLKIRNGIEWTLWREKVLQRDNFTCKKCNQYGGKLSTHHIEDFAHNVEVRFVIDNGITFCKKCHRKFHDIYGNKKGNNLEQLTEFLCQE